MNFKISAIPWFRLNFKFFYDREKEPRSKAARFLPPRPSLPLAFYMDQKMGYKGFQTEANSHEIQCEHHLVAGLFVCKKSVLAWDAGLPGRRGRRPLHSLAGGASKNPKL